MPDWSQYIRQNLRLPGVRPDREAEIVEDLAQQLEDAYREALAGGMAEADAVAFARQHVSDWDAFSRELQRLPHGAVPALERLQEGADTASRSRRWWASLGGLLRDLALFRGHGDCRAQRTHVRRTRWHGKFAGDRRGRGCGADVLAGEGPLGQARCR